MDLSIIIVNWNSIDYLQKCLNALYSSDICLKFEVIVIDAGSLDHCEQILRLKYPQVRFIQSENNAGFAASNNKAFAIAQGGTLLFLNPDTEVEGSAVRDLYGALWALPSAGIAGARLLNTDRSLQTSCIQAFPTILNQILNAECLRRFFPRVTFWGARPLSEPSFAPSEVDVVSGACLMIKRETFEKVGLFSSDYFMYSEDVDLCYQVHRLGEKSYFVPSAVVVHHGGGSSAQTEISAFSSVMIVESRGRFFKKSYSTPYYYAYRGTLFVASLARIALIGCAWIVSSDRAGWAGSFQRWRARLSWTLGMQAWAKDV